MERKNDQYIVSGTTTTAGIYVPSEAFEGGKTYILTESQPLSAYYGLEKPIQVFVSEGGEITINNLKVILRKSRVNITNDNIYVLSFLELMKSTNSSYLSS